MYTGSQPNLNFQIKWQGKAHYHATWEEFETVSAYRGFRKLENYFRKIIIEEMHFKVHQKDDPDDYDKYKIDREKVGEAIFDFQQVERVIGTRQGDEETEYYVKCTFSRCAVTFEAEPNMQQGEHCPTIVALGKVPL